MFYERVLRRPNAIAAHLSASLRAPRAQRTKSARARRFSAGPAYRAAVRCSGLFGGFRPTNARALCGRHRWTSRIRELAWPVRPTAALRAASFPRETLRAVRPRQPRAKTSNAWDRNFCAPCASRHTADRSNLRGVKCASRFSVRRLCRRPTAVSWEHGAAVAGFSLSPSAMVRRTPLPFTCPRAFTCRERSGRSPRARGASAPGQRIGPRSGAAACSAADTVMCPPPAARTPR